MPYKDKLKIKDYNRQYHLRTWAKRREKQSQLKHKRRQKLSKWLRVYKAKLKCQNCYESDEVCLDFHHTNAIKKEGTIGNMVGEGYSVETIMKEIKKCVVLCRNCHAKEHRKLKLLRV